LQARIQLSILDSINADNFTYPVVFVKPYCVALFRIPFKNALVSNRVTDASFLEFLSVLTRSTRSELNVAICIAWLEVVDLNDGTLRNRKERNPVW
jgi:hypothetical protein